MFHILFLFFFSSIPYCYWPLLSSYGCSSPTWTRFFSSLLQNHHSTKYFSITCDAHGSMTSLAMMYPLTSPAATQGNSPRPGKTRPPWRWTTSRWRPALGSLARSPRAATTELQPRPSPPPGSSNTRASGDYKQTSLTTVPCSRLFTPTPTHPPTRPVTHNSLINVRVLVVDVTQETPWCKLVTDTFSETLETKASPPPPPSSRSVIQHNVSHQHITGRLHMKISCSFICRSTVFKDNSHNTQLQPLELLFLTFLAL